MNSYVKVLILGILVAGGVYLADPLIVRGMIGGIVDPNIQVETWSQSHSMWTIGGVLAATLTSLFWIFASDKIFEWDPSGEKNHMANWILLLMFPIAIAALGFYLLPAASEGWVQSGFLILLVAVGTYWIQSLWATPEHNIASIPFGTALRGKTRK